MTTMTEIEEMATAVYDRAQCSRDASNKAHAEQMQMERAATTMAIQLQEVARFIERNAASIGEEKANDKIADIRRTLEVAAGK